MLISGMVLLKKRDELNINGRKSKDHLNLATLSYLFSLQADSDVALSQWVSMIEDTLRHQLQPVTQQSNQKTSTQQLNQQYGQHFQTASASASPNVYSNRGGSSRPEKETMSATDNENSNSHLHSAMTDEGEDTFKTGMRSSASTTSSKTDRKLTIGSRNRSPTGSSPKEKNRKASSGKIWLIPELPSH